MWAVVLESVLAEIQADIETGETPGDRLGIAAQTFVKYWLDHPDHFRLVFMSNDITRSDVSVFVQDKATLAHFGFFMELVEAALPSSHNLKAKTDALLSSMIGIALCANTNKDYPWTEGKRMTGLIVRGLVTNSNQSYSN